MTEKESNMGRPPVVLSEKQYAQVEALAAYLTVAQISDYFEISRATFYNLLDRDERLNRHYKKGKSKAIGNVASNLIQQAQNGNVGAAIFYLKTQAGWRETQHIEHTSPDGSMTPNVIEWVVVDEQADDPDS